MADMVPEADWTLEDKADIGGTTTWHEVTTGVYGTCRAADTGKCLSMDMQAQLKF